MKFGEIRAGGGTLTGESTVAALIRVDLESIRVDWGNVPVDLEVDQGRFGSTWSRSGSIGIRFWSFSKLIRVDRDSILVVLKVDQGRLGERFGPT